MPRGLLTFCCALALAVGACTPSDDPVVGDVAAVRSDDAPTDASIAGSDGTGEPNVEVEALLGKGAFVAEPLVRLLPMWDRPGSGEPADFRLDTRNSHGLRSPLLIEDARLVDGTPWYELALPIRPNGTTAWARGADVEVLEPKHRIVVDLSRRLLWHYRNGELAERLSVGVGAPATPTATGRFSVWVKVHYDDPNGVFGFLALGLSGFPPNRSEWAGDGRMAVHGTTDPSDRGQAVSAGCIRVYNGDLDALLGVPLGTPVVIRA